MEGLTRLVSESLAQHGFDRPLDYRRLHWSRWFRCENHHSLLSVPSKPGVFALAEEITHVATGASPVPQSEASGPGTDFGPVRPSAPRQILDRSMDASESRRLLAVTQFYENDDMAFVLDRMLSRPNPTRDRFASGRYFVRFVVIEDGIQRRSICSALNQWMLSTAEKATGIGSHFASSLELTTATEYVPQANDAQPSLFKAPQSSVGRTISPPNGGDAHVATATSAVPRREASGSGGELGFSTSTSITASQLDSGAATNIHCPSPFPSGF